MWLICGWILTIGIRARSKIWSYACPGEVTLLVPRGGWPSVGGATGWRWRARRHGRYGGWSSFGRTTRRGDRASSSWRRWTRIIVDGRGGAEVRCRESHEDHCPREHMSRIHGCASWHIVSVSSSWVVVMSKDLSLWELKCVMFEELPGSKDRHVRRQGGEEARPSVCLSEKIKLGV
jgi:hypothetical protein